MRTYANNESGVMPAPNTVKGQPSAGSVSGNGDLRNPQKP